MEDREPTFDLSELLAASCRAASTRDTPQFSDEARERVAALHNLCNRPGYNPTPAGDASAISNTSHQTNGAASNRSVVTENIQCHMPELCLELSALKQELLERSPDDPLFDEPLMSESNVENLSPPPPLPLNLKHSTKIQKRAFCCLSSVLLS
jgi:hypothetical protein